MVIISLETIDWSKASVTTSLLSMEELSILLALGLVAGSLSTLAGLGGGLVLTLALATLWDPTRALATAAPALLVGNVHRIALFRKHFDGRFVAPFVLGAVPGAIAGGLMAVALPETLLRFLILGTALAATVHELRGRRRAKQGERTWRRPGPLFIAGAAVVAGVVTATSGGGGLLLGPLLLAAGARGERFLVSASSIAVCMHVARIGAYGASDVVGVQTFLDAGVVALAILAGNALGRRARDPLGLTGESKRSTRLTYGVLGVSITLAVAGLA